jgi:hypothetical protein
MSLTTTATATLHHHHTVGYDATTGALSTTRGALSSQIEHENHHLSQSTRSGGERDLFKQQTYLAHPNVMQNTRHNHHHHSCAPKPSHC